MSNETVPHEIDLIELDKLQRRVASADGYLSLAFHRPDQWKDTVAREDANAIGAAISTLRTDVPQLIASYRALVRAFYQRPPPGYVLQRGGRCEARPQSGDAVVVGELINFIPAESPTVNDPPWVVELDDGTWFPLPPGWRINAAPRQPREPQ